MLDRAVNISVIELNNIADFHRFFEKQNNAADKIWGNFLQTKPNSDTDRTAYYRKSCEIDSKSF